MKQILILGSLFIVTLLGLIEAKKHHHHHKRKDHTKYSHHSLKHHSENHGEHHKKHEDQTTNHLGFKDQVRQFQMKIRSMLPRCESIDKCPKGTCCWKGKCKMLPHRINQRCSDQCQCNDEKNMLFCHLRTEGHNKRKYGRCFIKGTEIGMKGVNFIPEAIEKLKDVEKKLQKFGREQRKMKREHKKRDDKHKRGGKKHKHAGKRGNKKHGGRRHKHHKEMI